MKAFVASVLLGVVLVVAVFGLPIMLSNGDHHHGCPFMAGAEMCESTVIEHVSIWGSMFASLLSILVFALAVVTVHVMAVVPLPTQTRLRRVQREPQRLTAIQVLYSRGIYNCKEPYAYS